MPQGQEQGGKRSYLPRELRIKLYNEVISLRKSGLAYKRIIDEIWERYGVRLSKSNISCWIRGLHTPYKGRRIPSIELLKPSEWLAYVIGVRLGDGYTREVKKRVKGYNHVFLGLKANDVEFAEMFAASVANVLDRHPPKPIYDEKRRWYMVEVESRTLYELLKKPVDLNRLKKHIEHCERCTAAFLRGFADSEGSVSKEGYISVSNTDRELLEYVKDLLQRLGIESTGPRPTRSRQGTIARFRNGSYKRRKDSYYIYIKANGNINFYKNIGFTIKRKQKRLENYVRRRQTNPLSPPLSFLHSTLQLAVYNYKYSLYNKYSAGERIRTADRRVNSPPLYQAELPRLRFLVCMLFFKDAIQRIGLPWLLLQKLCPQPFSGLWVL
jgi:intein-encoded DNA endonuclease-like protein